MKKQMFSSRVFFATMLIAFVSLLSCSKSGNVDKGLMFETREITDPQFGGKPAATVYLPSKWKLEGKADWNYQQVAKPAVVGFIAKSPAEDAWFSMAGPFVVACYFSKSPEAAREAMTLGFLLAPPMKPEELVKKTIENDKSITDVKIVKVDKLDANAPLREKNRKETLAQLGGIAGLKDYKIEESVSHVTFTRNGVPWEALVYNGARYLYGKGMFGEYCVWDAGPIVVMQTHAGKMKDYDGVFGAIAGSTRIDPVWHQAMENVGNQLVQKRLAADRAQREAETRRIAASTYERQNRNRSASAINSRQESHSRVMRGWTNTVTSTDTWSGGDEKYAAPTGYDYAWKGSDGKTYYTNDSTFNPNYSSDFTGDWTPMKKTPW